MMPFSALLTLYPLQDIYCFIHSAWRFRFLASQVKSVDIEEFFKGFLITSGSTTFNYKTRELNACKMAGDTQPRCRVFWVIYKMADLKLGSRLLRDLVKHPHPRDHEFCQISYYSPATEEEIESNSRVMPGPPPLGLNIDRKIPRGKS